MTFSTIIKKTTKVSLEREGAAGGQQRRVTLAASCIPQFRWSCTIFTSSRCTLWFTSALQCSFHWVERHCRLHFCCSHNAAAHCPLRLVTELYCTKLADNAWSSMSLIKTTLCFLSHFPTKLAFSPPLQSQWLGDTWGNATFSKAFPISPHFIHDKKKHFTTIMLGS